MAMEFDPATLVSQAPATVLATLCLLELRALRPLVNALTNVLAALLERERAKDANDAGGNVVVPRVPTLSRLSTEPGNK